MLYFIIIIPLVVPYEQIVPSIDNIFVTHLKLYINPYGSVIRQPVEVLCSSTPPQTI